MQVIAMRKDRIPVAVSTVVLAVVTITYKLVLVLIGFAVILFQPARMMTYLDPVLPVIYLGLGLNILCVAALLLLVFDPNLVRVISLKALSLWNRIRPPRNLEKQTAWLNRILEQYQGSAEFYRTHQHVIIHVLFITFLQRYFLFLVTWFTYRSFDLSGQTMPMITGLQAMISVAADMLPFPGGMGISENLFLEIFQPIFGALLVLPGMIVSRGISYYTQLLICACMTAAAAIILNNHTERRRRHMIRFIGIYDYTVILTYIGLISSVFGITQAIHGDYKAAIFCLAFSGVCDAFDGRIARTKKNRTEDEKNFGIQLDSLCDVICFGVFPALICYLLGVRGLLGLILLFFYCTCAVIRLAFFNVLEGNRQKTEGGSNKVYRGLPVTSIAFILPMAFWLQFFLSELAFLILLHFILLVVAFLFILDFPLRKPGFKTILIMIGIVSVTVGIIFAYTKYKLPSHTDESNQLVEEVEEFVEEIYETEIP